LRVFVIVFLFLFSGAFVLASTLVGADQPITFGRILGSGMAVDNAGNIAFTGDTASFGQGGSIAYLFKIDPSGRRLCFRTWGPQNYYRPNGGTGYQSDDTFGYGVAFDSSNNMYWTGTTMAENHQDFDVFLIKYDPSCNQVYEVGWGGSPGNDIGRGVAVDASDNVYVTGSTSQYGNGQGFITSDIFLLKYGPSGEPQWSRTWGGLQNDYGTGVTVDSIGNIYVVGSTESYGGGQSDFVLLKYDPYGNLIFQKVWGGPQNDYGTGVAVDSGGDAYMTGYSYSYGSTSGVASAVLVKYDPLGNLLFAQTWGGKLNTLSYGVTVDAAGDAYVTGYSYGLRPVSAVATTFLLKYDPSGNLLSEQTWGGNKGDYAYAVVVDNMGNVFVTGYTYSYGPNLKGGNYFLLKYDPFGDLLYQRTYGGGVPLSNQYWTYP
jgi:hypothetical protein